MENVIRILGAYGGKNYELNTTCIQLTDNITIDAGNILKSLGDSAKEINHIFLTHSHFDHIIDIPFLIDTFYESRQEPLQIYGVKGTITALKEFILNEKIWPDFSEIKLLHSHEDAIVFNEITYGEIITFDEVKLKVIKNNHMEASCGYVITKNEYATLFTSDTYKCPEIWNEINENHQIKSVIVDVSFPSRFEKLAFDSKHLTPQLLFKELKQLKRNDVTIFINHLKPLYITDIKTEINQLNLLWNNGYVLKDSDMINLKSCKVIHSFDSNRQQIKYLNKIGYALTSEKNFDRLMDKILSAAKELTNADAGTIYLMNEEETKLKFKIVHTDSMQVQMGGTGEEIKWPDLDLYDEQGNANLDKISVCCALENRLINVPDVYEAQTYDFTGPKNFDTITNYKTKSMLVVPLINNDNDVIGVLQLINKKNLYSKLVEFNLEDEKLILSMGSQAAVAISNSRLIKGLETLLNAFIKSIATAIGEKSKYTVGHINRVAEITIDIARAINEDTTGMFKDKFYCEEELKQLDIAAWMHDVGKIATPEYVVDKATKLETIHDRIALVEAKFEVLKRDVELDYYKQLSALSSEEERILVTQKFNDTIESLEEDFTFIKTNNKGMEYMTDDRVERIHKIAKKSIIINNTKVALLSEDEVENLTIQRGTLTEKERFIINDHAALSLKMLESLPFPKKLREVPQIAGGHHEKIRGGGYPRNLKGDEISFEARILAIADIFEALTAHDRPYKEPNTLNQSLRILYFMAKDNDLDRKLVKFFIENKIYLSYTKYNLMPEQLDEVKIDCSDL